MPPQPLDFDDAVRRVRPRLQRYAVRRLGDHHEAEELVQEALLRAYSHREQLRTEEDLSAWSTVVTGRLVIDRLRVRGRSTSVAEVPEGSRVGRDTADVVVARDEARTALDALDAMPPRQAALLWAREVEGKSYDALCEQFAMTEPAVRSILTRARKSLRKEYATRGGTLPAGGLAVLAPWAAGLGWAEKLRRAATRVTVPAALGAVGITALGGLILAPFGTAPAPAQATTLFHPTQAIVTSASAGPAAQEVRAPHGLAPLATPRRSAPATVTAPQHTSTLESVVTRLDSTCTSQRTDLAGAGGTDCAPTDRATYLFVQLPANPTGRRQIGTEVGTGSAPRPVHCTDLPQNPLIQCSSQGDQK
ncbi:MAG: sigma-70 family RNA polymerase sigma factor [Mycobacteriales bacterium]